MVDTGVGMGPDLTSDILRLVVRGSACDSKAVMWSSDRFGTVKKNARRPPFAGSRLINFKATLVNSRIQMNPADESGSRPDKGQNLGEISC